MRKTKSLSFEIRKSFKNNGATQVCLPKEQTKRVDLQPGDPVACIQKEPGIALELKDGDIVIRNLKGVI